MTKRHFVALTMSASLVFAPLASGQTLDRQVPSELRQGYKVDALFCHLIEGKPKDQCFGSKADLQENVEDIEKALAKFDNALANINSDTVNDIRETVSKSANELGSFLKDCAAAADTNVATADPKNCVEQTAEEVTAAYKEAVDNARKACEKIPDNQTKMTCTSAVETFSSEADEGIAKLVQAAGPVLAFCAVSAGTGCAIMAALAILQLFLDGGGSGSGSGEQSPGEAQGEGNGGNAPPAPPPEQIFQGDDYGIANFAGSGIELTSKADPKFSFTIDGYYSGAEYTARDGGAVAQQIADEVNTMGSVGSYIAGKNEQFSVGLANDGDTGIKICVEDLPAFNVDPQDGQTGLEIIFLPGSEVSAQSADACP